jgi:hypothetical protein
MGDDLQRRHPFATGLDYVLDAIGDLDVPLGRRLADAVALIVGDQRLRIRGRLQLRLEPGGIEQQRVQPLALLSLRKRKREVIGLDPTFVSPAANLTVKLRGPPILRKLG